MVRENDCICPKCGGALKYYDSVKRIVRTKNRETNWIIVHRLKCEVCGSVHRELPDYIYPYKQYEAEVILGVIEGIITVETLGFEDYPCNTTINDWKISRKKHLL